MLVNRCSLNWRSQTCFCQSSNTCKYGRNWLILHTCMCERTSVFYIYIYMYVCVSVFFHIHTLAHTYTLTHIHTHLYIYIYIYMERERERERERWGRQTDRDWYKSMPVSDAWLRHRLILNLWHWVNASYSLCYAFLICEHIRGYFSSSHPANSGKVRSF